MDKKLTAKHLEIMGIPDYALPNCQKCGIQTKDLCIINEGEEYRGLLCEECIAEIKKSNDP